MKRFLLAITLVGSGAILAGCPIYSDTGNYRVCTSSTCYDCPDTQVSSACILWQCATNADCGNGLMCSGNTCGVFAGDASTSVCYTAADCPSGNWCLDGQCVEVDASSSSSSSVWTLDASPSGSDGGGEAGTSGDASGDASPQATPPCNADGQCGGGGARCINGQCTPQSGLCSDGTQCSSGESCVDGICTPQCAANNPCPIGYGCDLTRGVCSLNSTVCAVNSDCQGGTVCVEGYCVAPCVSGDAGPACPNAELCVNGGCIPNQAATFTCKNDGYTGAVANTCDTQSICLHDDCYVECNLDGGACADPSSVCKQVTIAQGTFAVCGPATELGSECDPAAGIFCPVAGTLCINGYCE
jgi:hypothetical protein